MKTDAINYNVLIPRGWDAEIKKISLIEGVNKSLFIRSTIDYWMKKHNTEKWDAVL